MASMERGASLSRKHYGEIFFEREWLLPPIDNAYNCRSQCLSAALPHQSLLLDLEETLKKHHTDQ